MVRWGWNSSKQMYNSASSNRPSDLCFLQWWNNGAAEQGWVVRALQNLRGVLEQPIRGSEETKIVSSLMSYKILTRPWMKRTVNSMYGPWCNKAIPFTTSELPRKDILRGAGKKPLLCVILGAWINKETRSTSHLVELLRARNIVFICTTSPQESESYGRINITTESSNTTEPSQSSTRYEADPRLQHPVYNMLQAIIFRTI